MPVIYRHIPAGMADPKSVQVAAVAFRSAGLMALRKGASLDPTALRWWIMLKDDVEPGVVIEGSATPHGNVLKVSYETTTEPPDPVGAIKP